MKTALAAVLLMASFSCHAECDTIGAHIASVHSRSGYNNINPGLYARCDGWTAGFYRNSDRRNSAYAGYTYEVGDRIRGAVTIGGVTGYPGHAVLPLLVPSVAVEVTDGVRVRMAVMHKPAMAGMGHSLTAATLMLEFQK